MFFNVNPHAAEPLRSQIARQLRAKILRGDLVAGEELPAPHRLARSHRVPATAVEQAYAALMDEGLVEQGGRRTVEVRSLSPTQRRELVEQEVIEETSGHGVSPRELELVREMQLRLLPPGLVQGDGFAICSRSFPARVVAGDFYDVMFHDDGSVGVVVADVAGKGLAAGLVMASVKAMTPFVANRRTVAETLTELNSRLCGELGARQFVALAYVRLDPASGRLEWANAGIPDLLVAAEGRPPRLLPSAGPRLPLAARRGTRYVSSTGELAPGERLLVLTDGIAEARCPGGDPLGYEAVHGLVADTPWDRAGAVWLDRVLDRALAVTGPVLDDDWTVVSAELAAGGRDRRGGGS